MTSYVNYAKINSLTYKQDSTWRKASEVTIIHKKEYNMESKIITAGNIDKVVISEFGNENVKFIGLVKANKPMTEQMKGLANELLHTLYEVWNKRYNRISWITEWNEFRYESLKNTTRIATQYEKDGKIYNSDPNDPTNLANPAFGPLNYVYDDSVTPKKIYFEDTNSGIDISIFEM